MGRTGRTGRPPELRGTRPGAVIYQAVSNREPAGKKLADCELQAVVLDYLTRKDWEMANRDNTEHTNKIIRLYLDGYTHTDIVRRSGHSYGSVENYLLDFARVTYLLERGLLLPSAGRQHVQGEIPLEALKPTVTTLLDRWGVRPAQVEGMVTLAARLYTWCCPKVEKLGPGQMV